MPLAAAMELDKTKADAFAERMYDVLNGGALALSISIGHRTGLFDVMGRLPPSTSQEIADAARLDERYVREWLGAMVTGSVVEHFPVEGTFRLPAEHAASLTRRASPDNMAVSMQFIPILAQIEDRIIDSFKNGGGVGHEHYPRFQTAMAELSRQTVVSALFDSILPLVPGLTVRLQEGIDVLDVGCGHGRALSAMACEYPNSRFRGIDLSYDAIAAANRRIADLHLHNITFEQLDAAALEEPASYDLITGFDMMADQALPERVLANINAALRPDGVFLMQDLATCSRLEDNRDHLIGPFLYTVSVMHCMTVSLSQGGPGLGTCWGKDRAVEMLEDAGFESVQVRVLPNDSMNYFYVARPRATP